MPLTQEQATGTLNPLSFLLVLQRPCNLNVKVTDWLFHQKVDSFKKKKSLSNHCHVLGEKTRTLNPVCDVWCKPALGEVPVGRELPLREDSGDQTFSLQSQSYPGSGTCA